MAYAMASRSGSASMRIGRGLSALLICLLLFCAAGWHAALGMKTLSSAMNTKLNGKFCTRILNATSQVHQALMFLRPCDHCTVCMQVGCQADRASISAPVHSIANERELSGFIASPPAEPFVILLNASLFSHTTLASLEKTHAIAGLLLAHSDPPAGGFSPASPTPFNSIGNGLSALSFAFPIVALGPDDSAKVAVRAMHNRAKKVLRDGGAFPRYKVRLVASMQAKGDSVECLSDNKCLPIGGYTPWTFLGPPPTNDATTAERGFLFSHKSRSMPTANAVGLCVDLGRYQTR